MGVNSSCLEELTGAVEFCQEGGRGRVSGQGPHMQMPESEQCSVVRGL